MKTTLISVLALFGLASAATTGTCSNTLSCPAPSTANTCCTPKYGLVVLNLQWIPGYGPSNAFTIHGLWPDLCSGVYAPSSGCDSTRNNGNISAVVQSYSSSLYSRMNTYWPSNTGDNNAFWVHEWNKHGTCVSTLDPDCYGSAYTENQDIIDYLTTVLNLRDKYDFYSVFSKAGYTPGHSYSVSLLHTAIKNAYGVDAEINCSSGSISDIALNFYVQGTSTYVPAAATSTGSCSGTVKWAAK